MAREGLGIVGAAVGFAYGGPVGMAIGWNIGYTAGGLLFPQKIPGPQLGEAPVQTSRDGVPIPRGWGIFHVGGPNIIWKGEIQEVTTTSRQGKGGSEVEETRRYLSFAIGVCEGPIYSIRRIWENNRLVYSTIGGMSAEDSTDFLDQITIYKGTESQNPDPEIETAEGVGNTPYFRGLCYIVFNNYDITDYGSMIPQYRVEVLGGADLTVTSRPYPLEAVDGYQAGVSAVKTRGWFPPKDYYSASVTPQGGYLRTALQEYTTPLEAYDATVTPQGGYMRTALLDYTTPLEAYDATVTPQGGYLRTALIEYTTPLEAYDTTITPLGGYLT